MTSTPLLLLALSAISAPLPPGVEMPVVADPRLKIELFAAEPDIVTPIGIAVDRRGRVIVVESQTHFRPPGYAGPPTDRIRVFEGADADGRAKKISTFFDGTKWTMNVALDRDGALYVATRSEIFRLRDTQGTGHADQRTPIAHLETAGTYPHNGLSGFAFDSAGNVYFGMGENLGLPFKLIGSDGSSVSGQEGGHIFRCRPDGSGLVRWATGFWNPFHLAFDASGELFAVDNDPDSRPPCRLLHVVEGGNYGFRYRNGRKGLHPFTAWDGELPGTLPMVAGTGEAPSGIVVYQADHLPGDYRGDLLVTSWGDHRIERFTLVPRGASYGAKLQAIVTGGENFRPVGIATAPDGSLYITDWVDKSYPVHGKGRIWHLSAAAPQPHARRTEPKSAKHPLLVRAETLRSISDPKQAPVLWKAACEPDAFIQQAAREGLKKCRLVTPQMDLASRTAPERLACLLILRESADPQAERLLPAFLKDADPDIRFAAVQWVGEEKLEAHRQALAAVLAAGPATPRLFAGYLAALEKLDGIQHAVNDEWVGEKYLVKALLDANSSTLVRRWALRTLRPDHPALNLDQLSKFLASGDSGLRLEAVRSLRESPLAGRRALLEKIVNSPAAYDVRLRAEAIVGLAAEDAAARAVLLELAEGSEQATAHEALRSLRGAALGESERARLANLAKRDSESAELVRRVLEPKARPPRPPVDDTAGWLKLLAGEADAEAGRRIFFHGQSAACSRCHQMNGRGGRIGPDLSTAGRALDRSRLVESILRPSKEIAPQFVPWLIVTTDGRSITGLLVAEGISGEQAYVTEKGEQISLKPEQIEQRRQSQKSIMPDGLQELLTLQEFRDLLAFLTAVDAETPLPR